MARSYVLHAGDAIHPVLQKGVVWFTRLVAWLVDVSYIRHEEWYPFSPFLANFEVPHFLNLAVARFYFKAPFGAATICGRLDFKGTVDANKINVPFSILWSLNGDKVGTNGTWTIQIWQIRNVLSMQRTFYQSLSRLLHCVLRSLGDSACSFKAKRIVRGDRSNCLCKMYLASDKTQ